MITSNAMKLPSGKVVSLGAFVRDWRTLRTLNAHAHVTGWDWYPTQVSAVLRAIRRGVDDRVNIRSGLVLREPSEKRIARQLGRRIKHECRWCGSPIGRYAAPHDRFCDRGCRDSYYG